MKKMAMLFAMLLCLGSFNSCSSDKKEDTDDDSGSSTEKLVGTWKWVGDWTDGVYEEDVVADCNREILQYNAGGTYVSSDYICGGSTSTIEGTWSKTADNQYQIVGDLGSGSIYTVFTANNTKVAIYRSASSMAIQDMGAVYVRQ
jgi:hypothetical protein